MPTIHDDANIQFVTGLADGGTGADLSATGPGLLCQATSGAPVTATTAPTITQLVSLPAGVRAYTNSAVTYVLWKGTDATNPRAAGFSVANLSAIGTRTVQMPEVGGTMLAASAVGTTVGAAGGASALPATPLGYIKVSLIDGSQVVIPYYTAP